MDVDGQEFVIAYASRSNNKTKAQYNFYEGQCLAAIWTTAYFWSYLVGDRPSIVEVVDGVKQAHGETRALGLDVDGVQLQGGS
jgi:hypothetical protein